MHDNRTPEAYEIKHDRDDNQKTQGVVIMPAVEVKLGTAPGADSKRDAVHVAVLPMSTNHWRAASMPATTSDEQAMRAIIAAEVARIGSLRQAAKKWKVSPAYLSDVLNARRNPGPAILRPLGYERRVEVTYRKCTEAK